MCRVVAVCGNAWMGSPERPVDEIELVEGQDGDESSAASKGRVSLTGCEPFSGMVGEYPGIGAGACAENITISGLDLDELPAGTRLWVGDRAVLEVTGTEGVPHRKHQPQRHIVYDIMPKGLLARVVTGGMVRKGDQVVILSLGRKTTNPV